MHRLTILFLIGTVVGCASDGGQPGTRSRDVIKEYSCSQLKAEMDLLARAEGAPVRATASTEVSVRNQVRGVDLDSTFPDPRNKHRTGELGSHRYSRLRDLWFEKRCGDL